ncbi:uncharacterized mitochondrial protein AtMg00710-like [Cicer arietinum]|uniref:uncharacterized mitochondrial protein AtMg00710-like n=1 Tax=Cicer arietinum TaxID=3827 RepID=UPI003CC5D763
MNRTFLERVRCMILSVGLPKTLCGEATVTTVYLINRCPSSTIGFKTPIEMWSGKPTDYSILKVFGSLAFVHTRQDKLDPRAIICAFIGYPTGIKGYKLWRVDQGVPNSV